MATLCHVTTDEVFVNSLLKKITMAATGPARHERSKKPIPQNDAETTASSFTATVPQHEGETTVSSPSVTVTQYTQYDEGERSVTPQPTDQRVVQYHQRWPTVFGAKPHEVAHIQLCLKTKISFKGPNSLFRTGVPENTVENWCAYPFTAKGNLRRLPGARELTVVIPSRTGTQTYLVTTYTVPSQGYQLVRVDALTEYRTDDAQNEYDQLVSTLGDMDMVCRDELLPATAGDIAWAFKRAFPLQPAPEAPGAKRLGPTIFAQVERCVLRAAADVLAGLHYKKMTELQQLDYLTSAILKKNTKAVVAPQSEHFYTNLLEVAIQYVRQHNSAIQLARAPAPLRKLRTEYRQPNLIIPRVVRYRNLVYHPHMIQPMADGATKFQLREIARAYHTLRTTPRVPRGYGMLALRSGERDPEDTNPEVVHACSLFT